MFSPVVALAPLAVGGLLLARTLLAAVDEAGVSDVGRLRSRYDAQIRDAAREATTEMEALIDELQATPLENVGLVEAVKKQCEALRFRTDATVDLDIGALPASDVVLPGTHDALYRVGQEAIANVARHARATHVNVSLARQGSRIRLRAADDGRGFDPAASTGGMGQRNTRTRAADIGGDVRVTRRPAQASADAQSLAEPNGSAWAAPKVRSVDSRQIRSYSDASLNDA